ELQPSDARLKVLAQELASRNEAGGDKPSPTNGYHSEIASIPDELKWVEVDLKEALPIDEVRLIPARPTDFPDTPGFGFPLRFRVEAHIDSSGGRRTLLDQCAADFPNPGAAPLVV